MAESTQLKSECKGYLVIQQGEWEKSATFIPATEMYVSEGEITIIDGKRGQPKAVYAPGRWSSVHRIDSLDELTKLSPKIAEGCLV